MSLRFAKHGSNAESALVKHVKACSFLGTNGLWGVQSRSALIYEPIFTMAAAERLSELENQSNPPDWEHAEEILIKEGLLQRREIRNKQPKGETK